VETHPICRELFAAKLARPACFCPAESLGFRDKSGIEKVVILVVAAIPLLTFRIDHGF